MGGAPVNGHLVMRVTVNSPHWSDQTWFCMGTGWYGMVVTVTAVVTVHVVHSPLLLVDRVSLLQWSCIPLSGTLIHTVQVKSVVASLDMS